MSAPSVANSTTLCGTVCRVRSQKPVTKLMAGLVLLVGLGTACADESDTGARNTTSTEDDTTTTEPTTTTESTTTTTEEPTTTTAAPTTTTTTEEPTTTTTTSTTTTLPPTTTTTAPPEDPEVSNARRSAESYLDLMGFSRTGLIEQLEFEGYSVDAATAAVDSLDVDWFAEAAESAQSYIDMMGFSRSGLVEQLIFEGFTTEEAEHGATAVGL